MSKTHIITHIDGITKIKFLVTPSLDQVKSIIDEIVENYPYERKLWDMSEIKFDLSTNEIRMLSEYGKQIFEKPNKVAIYAVDDLAFGEMRQFGVYREEKGKTLSKVFRDEQNAIEWLKSERT